MELKLSHRLGGGYESASQRARVITERWAEEHLYCPGCTSNRNPRNRCQHRARSTCVAARLMSAKPSRCQRMAVLVEKV